MGSKRRIDRGRSTPTVRHLRIHAYLKVRWYAPAMAQTQPRPAPAPSATHAVEQPTTAQVSAAVTSFALLADPTRVRILWALREHEADVATLAALAQCRATAASQHLAKLRLAGLVQGDRRGRHVIYRLSGGHVRNLLTEGLFHADHQVSGEPTHD